MTMQNLESMEMLRNQLVIQYNRDPESGSPINGNHTKGRQSEEDIALVILTKSHDLSINSQKVSNDNELTIRNLHSQPIPTNNVKPDIWVGFVEEISEESILVSFFDNDDKYQIPRYQAKFSLDRIWPEEDRELLEVGAYLYWETGYALDSGNTLDYEKYSRLRLIKSRPITESDVKNAKVEAKKLLEGMVRDESPGR